MPFTETNAQVADVKDRVSPTRRTLACRIKLRHATDAGLGEICAAAMASLAMASLAKVGIGPTCQCLLSRDRDFASVPICALRRSRRRLERSVSPNVADATPCGREAASRRSCHQVNSAAIGSLKLSVSTRSCHGHHRPELLKNDA